MQHWPSPLHRARSELWGASTHCCKGSASLQVLRTSNMPSLSTASSPKGGVLNHLARATLRQLPPFLPRQAAAPTIFLERPTCPLLPRLQVSKGGTEDRWIPISFRKGGFCTFSTSESTNLKLERKGGGGEVVVDLALLKYMDVAESTHCCLLHPGLCCGYHRGSCLSYPAYFLTCARPPFSIPVKPSNSTSWRTAGNSTGAKGPLWGEQTILYIQPQNTRRTILDSFTTLTTKKSHSFLHKLLSVWGSDISKGQFANKFGLILGNGTAFGCSHNNILALLEKGKKTKQNPPWSDFTSRRAPKQMQDNKEHAGATRLLNATIYVLKLAVPRHHLYIRAITSSL